VCAICGRLDAIEPYFAEGSRGRSDLPWVVRCSRCELVFAHPQPTDEELGKIYDDEYYEQFGFAGRRVPAGLVFTKQATYASLLERAEAHLPESARSLLDVGCGLGFSLLAASARGWTATGIDPLAPADASLVPGRTMVRGTLEGAGFSERFDLVTLVDAIEHVRDPSGTIAAAKRALKPGGLLVLATNDVASLGAKLLESRWPHFHRAHLWFFTPSSLSRIAEKEGLEVVEVRTASRVCLLRASRAYGGLRPPVVPPARLVAFAPRLRVLSGLRPCRRAPRRASDAPRDRAQSPEGRAMTASRDRCRALLRPKRDAEPPPRRPRGRGGAR
jgi:SAM-dependent methyltransferase